MAIKSFKDKRLKVILERGATPRGFPPSLLSIIERKLVLLDAAEKPEDLRHPPANRLELLKGDRFGQYSIRVNNQYRLCFEWTEDGPTNVEFVDYH